MSAQSSPVWSRKRSSWGGDRVTVGLVVDQNTTERIAGARVEGLDERAKVIVSHD